MPLFDRFFAAPSLQKLLSRAGFFRLDTGLTEAAGKRAAMQAHASLVSAVLERYDVDCVVDVGANQGQFARSLRENGYRGAIVSFEPVEEQFRSMSAQAEGDPDWHVRKEALGSSEGTRDIHVMRRSEFSSFLTPAANQPTASAGRNEIVRTESVAIRRLDVVANAIPAIAVAKRIFLKLDTQGFDLEVFQGAENLLPRIVALQSELSMVPIYEGMPHFTKALERYDAAGFVLASVVPVVRDQDTLAAVECDCLLLRTHAEPREKP